MVYFSLIDILFFIAGLGLGVIITACASASGYEHKCDTCVYREIVELMEVDDERQ